MSRVVGWIRLDSFRFAWILSDLLDTLSHDFQLIDRCGLLSGYVTMQTLTANRRPTIIGKGGIVRIPAAMREEMDLRPGDNVLLERINENEIRLRVTDRKERCISDDYIL